MAGSLFVLAKGPDVGQWMRVAGPTDAAGARDAVTQVLRTQPGARAIVVQLLKSFAATVQVTEDQTPTVE